jgi:hypothetical protein
MKEDENNPLRHIALMAKILADTNEFKTDNYVIKNNENKKQNIQKSYIDITQYFDINNDQMNLIKDDNTMAIEYKNNFIKKKNQLFGTALHLYLSYIMYDIEEEHDNATSNIKKKYGNILNNVIIEQICQKAKKFVKSNELYFNKENWNKIFTEFTVFDNNNKPYRIDRMMINTPNAEILIIDYKSGSLTDQNQVEQYISLIKKIPYIKNNNYKTTGKYLEI